MVVHPTVSEIILTSIAQAAAWVSEAGKVVFANERLAALLGRSRDAIVGTELCEAVAPGDRNAFAAMLAARPEAATHELSMLRSGMVLSVEATIAALPFGESLCLFTDVRERELTNELRSALGPIRTSAYALQRLQGMPSDGTLGLEIISQQARKMSGLLERLRSITKGK